MAKQTINLGTGELTGDGESIRSAFDKVNDNFDEIYARDVNTDAQTLSIDGNTISITGGNSITIAPAVSLDGDLTGSVFGDDSTLLVDGVNNTIPKANIEDSANWDTAFGWGNHTAGGYAPQTTTYTKTEVDSAISAVNTLDGDFTGSVFADDSTLLVDGVNGKFFGDIEAGKVVGSSGSDLTIRSHNVESGTANDVLISGGVTADTGFEFGGSVKIQGGDNVARLQENGSIEIGTEHTNGITIGAYDFGDGFGSVVSLAGFQVIIGEANNRSSVFMKGTVDFSNATVTGLDVALTGDLTGSVFADDSTLLVDGVNGVIPYSVLSGAPTIPNLASVNQSIIPDTNEAYDIGSATNRFRDLYLSGNTIDLGGATISLNPQNGLIDLPIDASASLGLPPNVGINGFYGLSADFSDGLDQPIDPIASTAIAPNAELDALSGPIFAYSKIVFATPIPGYGAGIEYDYFNFLEIINDGKTPPTIVADIDGSGNLISLEITALGNATGAGESLLFYPTGDPDSVNGGQLGLQDADGSAPIVTAPGGVIPGYISLADLKTEVAASADFAAFKIRIAAL